MSSIWETTKPSRYMGTFLYALCKQFPKFVFTSGVNKEGRYCVFIHRAPANGDTLPDVGSELAEIETNGGSDKDLEVLFTKIALLHG